jgi:hypothetical protein
VVAVCTVREARIPNVLGMKIRLERKVILPLASVLGAGALAVATGMLGGGASAASDGVRLAADEDGGATLVVTALEPGDSVSRTVTIENTTGGEGRLTFTEQGDAATFADGELQLAITRDGVEVYAGQFGAMGDYAQDMGFLQPGEDVDFTFTVSLPDDAAYVPAGTQSASASYDWLTEAP